MYNSNRPAIIVNESKYFALSLIQPKVFDGETFPIPGPTLLRHAIEEVNAVVISISQRNGRIAPTSMNMIRYRKRNAIILLITDDSMRSPFKRISVIARGNTQ